MTVYSLSTNQFLARHGCEVWLPQERTRQPKGCDVGISKGKGARPRDPTPVLRPDEIFEVEPICLPRVLSVCIDDP